MLIYLFGGRQGRSVADYFQARRNQIKGLINTLKHQQVSKDEIRQRIIEQFTLPLVNINYNERQYNLLSNVQREGSVDGIPMKIHVGTYTVTVHYTGVREIIECMPIDERGDAIFHGYPVRVFIDVAAGIITSQRFDAHIENTDQIENLGQESIGDYYENLQRMNTALRKWNEELTTIEM